MTTRVWLLLGRRTAGTPSFHAEEKKNLQKSQEEPEKGLEKKNEKSAGHPLADAARDSQVKRDFQRRKRRGPTPFPKEDIKVILRPHKGLTVKNLFGSELSMAVIEACQNSFGGESFLLRAHPGSNIIILSTPHEQLAGRLREINQLKIRGRIHPFNAYVADPEHVLRGIVHGLPPGTTQADLMANLRIRTQGVKIERARMLGSSKSAIITFTGDVLPSHLKLVLRRNSWSDYHIIATTLPLASLCQAERKVGIKNRDKFLELQTASQETDGYDDWLTALAADLDAAMQSITTMPINPDVVPPLLHLWDTRSACVKRVATSEEPVFSPVDRRHPVKQGPRSRSQGTSGKTSRELRTASREVDGYDDSLAALTANLYATTQSITTTPINPDMDPHLLHL
ncbi:hypothetical protein HPB51_016489 [Rhipicephalus microplus]|uniref:Uncharacterized protein n=1 Tax=Rhipicephalus microplus TaxID=6941 RepID=A0A9J6DNY1_RHIMP|nr:hypothetical protein HPB51_016489 [Rhipicephalus microplus]